jgi:thymidine kinase
VRGSLLAIYGPMFSGKTASLLTALKDAERGSRHAIAFKPALDPARNLLISHDHHTHPAMSVSEGREIVRLAEGASLIVFDEAQFMDESLVAVLREMADAGAEVIAAGLDTDFRREPFPTVEALRASADRVLQLQARCSRCGRPADFTQRFTDGKPAPLSDSIVLIGGADTYQPRCASCFEEERQ